jgi:hypothetical protein
LRKKAGTFVDGLSKNASKSRANARGNSGAADEILKSWVAPQRVESGIHPDPWYSSGTLQKRLLQRLKSFFFFA